MKKDYGKPYLSVQLIIAHQTVKLAPPPLAESEVEFV